MQPEGVLIMVPKGMYKIARKVVVPTHKDLEGRGLMIWFSRGLYDLTLTSVYCPLCDRDVQNHKKTERLWQWAARTRSLIPNRTRHIMGTDANGRVGSVRHYTTEDPTRVEDLEDDADYVHIGDKRPDEENKNGTLMREYLERTGMEAFNTWDPEACGHTWTGGKGATSRVDYMLQDVSFRDSTVSIHVAREFRRTLRGLVALEDNDHFPLRLRVRLKPWGGGRPQQKANDYDRQAMTRSCLTWDIKA